MIEGLIIRAQSGFFTVRTGQGDVVCRLRGRLKQQRRTTDLATIGDHVLIELEADGVGTIEHVAPRTRALTRRAPGGFGRRGYRAAESEREQVIIANPDLAVFVFACAQPDPHPRALDRYLVMAEAQSLPAMIVANKADLAVVSETADVFAAYPPLGYPVIRVSARTGVGVAELRAALQGKIAVLAGPSGVGKSSLVNALEPGLKLQANSVSEQTLKGRHTTVFRQLHALTGGGYIADTPGMRALELFNIEPDELDAYFVELRPLVSGCAFSDCTHEHEPGCAVRAAVADGRVSRSRYDSYLKLRHGDDRTSLTDA